MLDFFLAFDLFCRWQIYPKIIVSPRFFRFALISSLLRAIGCVSAQTDSSGRNAIQQARDELVAGNHIVLMPEGVVVAPASRADGLGSFKSGMARLLEIQPADVLLIALKGTDEVLPLGKFVPHLSRQPPHIRVAFAIIRRDNLPQQPRAITAEIREKLLKLLSNVR
jgi:1-acyl-sn-glycerol-3-phosphate acyltransferase